MTKYLSDMTNERPGKQMQLDISGAGTTEWVIIDRHPDGRSGVPVTVGLNPGTGEGYVQITNDSLNTVLTASAASCDWASGTITAPSLLEIPSAVTAVRAVTTGAGQLTIQRD